MKQIHSRRYSNFYEIVVFSRAFSILFGILFAVVIPIIFYWGLKGFVDPDNGQKNSIIIAMLGVALSKQFFHKTAISFPGARAIILVIPYALTVYSALIIFSLFFRLDVSRVLLFFSGIGTLFWLIIEQLLLKKFYIPKLALLQSGETQDIAQLQGIDARYLTSLSLGDTRYDGVVADFQKINDEEERFLTTCALTGTSVYNARQVYESLTGRVKINKMSENNIGALLPSTQYELAKFIFDILLVTLTFPVTIPICIVTILLIRIESPGPAIYKQQRVGRGNKVFTIYKLRSMRFDKAAPEEFAGENDPRITRIGKIIRKTRIDELPQFLNIIKGEMSLIGPRPEQPNFVKDFDKKIPFYSYRHVVKPGITGWAQVRQGYTSDTETTQIKIEHDFYYIKNCSLSLDVYICFLTIKTMLSGFGAR